MPNFITIALCVKKLQLGKVGMFFETQSSVSLWSLVYDLTTFNFSNETIVHCELTCSHAMCMIPVTFASV